MPRNVRNFWVNLNVDGRSNVETGPASKDGGMWAKFLIRSNGDIADSITVDCVATSKSNLLLRVYDPNGKCIFEQETER